MNVSSMAEIQNVAGPMSSEVTVPLLRIVAIAKGSKFQIMLDKIGQILLGMDCGKTLMEQLDLNYQYVKHVLTTSKLTLRTYSKY